MLQNTLINKNKKGFTLVELLIVISLISILSGILISVINPNGMRQKFRDGQRISDLKRLQSALELYFADNRMYPDATAGTWVQISLSAPTGLSSYINPVPVDPGTNAYYYRTNAARSAYTLEANLELNSSMTSFCSSAAFAYNCQNTTNCCRVVSP
jgi:prepilin-type N-terminal cleavage/methylation domain-containing protein